MARRAAGGPGRGRLGGNGSAIARTVWVVFALCVALAVLRAFGATEGTWWSKLQDGVRTAQTKIVDPLANWLRGASNGIKIPGVGAQPAPAPTGSSAVLVGQAKAALDQIPVGDGRAVAYERDQWRHWTSVRTCWAVDEQVKARDALPGSLVFKDSRGAQTTDVRRACSIVSGKWVDPYTGTTITQPRLLDVDHMVPLENAARSGGQGWSAARKQAYANDLTPSYHLRAVSAAANRSKGSRGPETWLPSNKAFVTTYVAEWVDIKKRWGLSMTPAERAKVAAVLAGR